MSAATKFLGTLAIALAAGMVGLFLGGVLGMVIAPNAGHGGAVLLRYGIVGGLVGGGSGVLLGLLLALLVNRGPRKLEDEPPA